MNTLPHLTQTDLHLTDEQFADLLDRAEPSNPHLDACAECQSELFALRSSLLSFRTAATNLAAVQTPQLVRRQTYTTPRSHFRRPIWAASLATAAVLLTVSVSVFRPHHVGAVTPVAAPEVVTVSDEALLDGIQSDLSTSIPPSLEPLAVPTATPSSH